MSKGPGSVEAAIAEAFASNPRGTFTVAELLPHCYPGAAKVEQKHRVAILRAAEKVCERTGWNSWEHTGRLAVVSGPKVFCNFCDIRSLVLGFVRQRAFWNLYGRDWSPEKTDEEARQLLAIGHYKGDSFLDCLVLKPV